MLLSPPWAISEIHYLRKHRTTSVRRGKGRCHASARFFGVGDVGTSSKVQGVKPPPSTTGLGSHATSFSRSCHPFLSSLCVVNHSFEQNTFVCGVLVEIPLALWHSQLTARVPRTQNPQSTDRGCDLRKTKRRAGRGRESKAAESVVHSGSCSLCGAAVSSFHRALDSTSQLPPRCGGGERWGLSVMSCRRGRGRGGWEAAAAPARRR